MSKRNKHLVKNDEWANRVFAYKHRKDEIMPDNYMRVINAGSKIALCPSAGGPPTYCDSIKDAVAVLDDRGYDVSPLKNRRTLPKCGGIKCPAKSKKRRSKGPLGWKGDYGLRLDGSTDKQGECHGK